METELVTARLRLRRARPDDVAGLHALVSDWEVVKQTATWPWPPERAFTESRALPMAPGMGLAGPVLAGGAIVGMMGVDEAAGPGRGHLGYMFARAHWGRGYATEMGRALIAHAWARYPWREIVASVFADNPASVRVLEKLGFTEGAPGEGPGRARGGTFALRRFTLARP